MALRNMPRLDSQIQSHPVAGSHLAEWWDGFPKAHLHHALQAGGGFEGGAAVVLVLGVDELSDEAAAGPQLRHVRLQAQHQLVDVA